MKPKDLASYLFLAGAWGLSFLVILKAEAAFGWVGAVAFRSFVASATLLLLAAVTARRLDFGFGLAPLAVVGATTVAGQLLGLSYAIPEIGTAMAAIIVATIPMFSMLISRLFRVELIPAEGVVGLCLGGCGIVMLVGFPAVAITPDFVLGCLSALFGCLCAAVGSVYASQRLRGAGTWEMTAGSFLWGGIFSLPFLLIAPVPVVPQPVDYLYLVILGSVMSATTYVLYFRLVSTIGPTRAISVEFAVTVVAVFVGAVVLDEPLTAVQLVGAATIVLGCALVLGLLRLGRRKRAGVVV